MEAEKEVIIRRYRKLMALATKDPDTPEAQSAARKAAEYAAEYGLSFTDVEEDGHVKQGHINEEDIQLTNRSFIYWEERLAMVISNYFDAKVLRFRETLRYIGTIDDVANCIWLHKFLRITIAKNAEEKFAKVAEQKEYGLGFTTSVGLRLKTMKAMQEQEEEKQTSDCRALIVVKKDDIIKYTNEKYRPKKRGVKHKNKNGSFSAYADGMADGNTVSLNRQVEQ